MSLLHPLQGNLRLKILDLYFKANAGHIACSLSCIDLMIASLLTTKKETDTFILSKGHAAAALYVCLNYIGEISDEQLETYYKNGTTLPAHPAANKYLGIPFATGSLGHGLPIATGIAKANKLTNSDDLIFVLLSDGETNEGTTFEAANFARQHQLDNLIVMIDKNKLQGFGYTNDVLGDSASKELWISLGFDVYINNGHNVDELVSCIEIAKKLKNNKPKVIIADTIKGKGISYMENKLFIIHR